MCFLQTNHRKEGTGRFAAYIPPGQLTERPGRQYLFNELLERDWTISSNDDVTEYSTRARLRVDLTKHLAIRLLCVFFFSYFAFIAKNYLKVKQHKKNLSLSSITGEFSLRPWGPRRHGFTLIFAWHNRPICCHTAGQLTCFMESFLFIHKIYIGSFGRRSITDSSNWVIHLWRKSSYGNYVIKSMSVCQKRLSNYLLIIFRHSFKGSIVWVRKTKALSLRKKKDKKQVER